MFKHNCSPGRKKFYRVYNLHSSGKIQAKAEVTLGINHEDNHKIFLHNKDILELLDEYITGTFNYNMNIRHFATNYKF